MKQLSKLGILLILAMQSMPGFSQSQSFKTYTNPVIPGDHSDCTLTQIGKDFYTTGSSFNATPVIYHSTDLIHWEAIAQPVSADWSLYDDRPTGGCWGGQMVKYNDKYWDYFSRANAMYFVNADKPEGPWSTPVKVNNPTQLPYGLGYDNSIFIDDDGKWYLVVKNGQENNGIVQLGNDGQPTGIVYNLNWLNPKGENHRTPFSWAEGPVMWKHNGYYYYSFARDVSGGQKVMHSKTLTADKAAWTYPVDLYNENDPGKAKAIFWGPNHSSAAIMLGDSTNWVLHPVWARANDNEWYGQGRQGLVNQLHYDANNNVVADYPVNEPKTAPKLPSSDIPWMVPHSDFFSTSKLHPEWSFLGFTPTSSISCSERPGWLRISPKSPTKANTVIKTDAEHNYSLITRLDFAANSTTDEAGIRIISGTEDMYAKLYSSLNAKGKKVIAFSFDSIHYESTNPIGNTLWLKMVRINHSLTGYFSADGKKWNQVGTEINVLKLDSNTQNYNGWCGNRQGLYASGKPADFDLYIYRDAYTPILAECTANQFGTTKTIPTKGISCLDDISDNDWAMYAGVEFGGNVNYSKKTKTFEVLASSATSGGKIEVWLDSIATGRKIAECPIKKTGDRDTYKTFSVPVPEIEGRHDVYLRFKGSNTNNIFRLKWINFKTTNK